MKAAVLTAHGRPPSYAEHPDPHAGDGEVLVRMTAAPIVPLDLICASGTSYFGPPALPYVPGVQGVGVTEAGDRVWISSSAGMRPGDGTLGEWCTVPGVDVVPVDGTATDPEVAAIGLSGVAAWSVLHLRARMQPGERVLVLGAGGAVGQVATAVAREGGAGRVVGACRGPAAEARARASGADEVVRLPASGDPADLAALLGAALDGAADVVVDPVWGWVAQAATMVAAPGARLVHLGGSAGDDASLSSSVIRGKHLDVLGYTNNALTPEQRAGALTSLVALASRGVVRVEHRVRPLTEVTAAWGDVAAGAAGVRQVLVP